MSIEVLGSNEQTHIENIFYDVHCLTCPDVSKENGDALDRPLELVGFEENATWEDVFLRAQNHDRGNPDHKIVIRKFDTGLIERTLG